MDGLWSPWSHWSPCTASCDGGMQQRSRKCNRPLFGGVNCIGDTSQNRKCNVHPCKGVFCMYMYLIEIINTSFRIHVSVWIIYMVVSDYSLLTHVSLYASAGIPHNAIGNIIGNVNKQDLGLGRLFANVTRTGRGTHVAGIIIDLPDEISKGVMFLITEVVITL